MVDRSMKLHCDWKYISDETFERIKNDFINHLKKEIEYCRRIALNDVFTIEERLYSIDCVKTCLHERSLEHLENIEEELEAEVRDAINEFDDDIEFIKNWVKKYGEELII